MTHPLPSRPFLANAKEEKSEAEKRSRRANG